VRVLADKAHSSKANLALLARRGIKAVIHGATTRYWRNVRFIWVNAGTSRD
jgi:hypothetical protein